MSHTAKKFARINEASSVNDLDYNNLVRSLNWGMMDLRELGCDIELAKVFLSTYEEESQEVTVPAPSEATHEDVAALRAIKVRMTGDFRTARALDTKQPGEYVAHGTKVGGFINA